MVPSSNLTGRKQKLLTFAETLYFFAFFKNLIFSTKNYRLSNQFWLYQHRVKYVPFLCYSHLKSQNFKWNTLYEEIASQSPFQSDLIFFFVTGIEQSRRDDLEALGYIFIYFYKGVLPWQGLKAKTKAQKYEKISEKKLSTPIEELCNGSPSKLVTGRFCACQSMEL